MHVFYAQGGGLGHLTRIDTLVKQLEIPQNNVIIIAPLTFTKYFNYTFIGLSWQDDTLSWTEIITTCIKQHKITSFYIDAFPFGLKGELITIYKKHPNINYIYISRVLKWSFYLKSIQPQNQIIFSKTLLLEKLYTNHYNWILKHSKSTETLSINESVPQKNIVFSASPYIVIVHSGGKNDVLKLCGLVVKNECLQGNIIVAVFTQVNLKYKHPKFKIFNNIYPVNLYFKHALKIYTGCGFNAAHQLKPYKNKHIIIPFEKLYDDQYFRKTSINT